MIEKQIPFNNQIEDAEPQEREVNYKEILNVIIRRKYGIVFIFLTSIAIAWFIHWMQPPEYQAVSIMMINDQNNLFTPVGSGSDYVSEQALTKDIVLLRSTPVAELAVKELIGTSNNKPLELFGQRYYIPRINRLFGWSLLKHDKETKPDKSKGLQYSDEKIRQYGNTLSGRTKVEPIPSTHLLKVSVASPFQDEAVLLTNALCKVYRDGDIQRNSEKYTQANKFITQLIRDQERMVTAADKSLSKYMAENGIYEVTGNVQQLLGKITEIDAKYNDIQAEYHIAQNSLDFLENKLSEADKGLSARVAQNVNTKLVSILEEIRVRQTEYIQLVNQKGADNVEVKAKKQQLEVVKARYEQLSRSKIAGEIGYAGRVQKYNIDLITEKLQAERKRNLLTFSANEFSRLKKYYEEQVKLLPKKQQEYAKLQRDREVVGKTYIFLKEKLDENRIRLGSEVGGVSVIGTATRPLIPENASPRKDVNFGAVIGLVLAVLYTFTAEMIDDTVKDEGFFKNYGFNILATLPVVYVKGGFISSNPYSKIFKWLHNTGDHFRKRYFPSVKQTAANSLVSKGDAETHPKITDQLSSGFAESLRTLRTALDYCRVESPLKTIIVSGTAMSEGKSTVCANLGMAFAINGKKTLILDCDLRRPSLHKIFNIHRTQGLTDYLFSQNSTVDADFIQPTHLDNLFILSAGKRIPNPNEILGSSKMQDLIKELSGQFDKIIFDCTPLFLSDAAQLAYSVDGILLVARLHFTDRKPLKEYAIDHFLRPRIIGIALIDSHKPQRYGYGKYGYGKYGYGKYGYGNEDEAS